MRGVDPLHNQYQNFHQWLDTIPADDIQDPLHSLTELDLSQRNITALPNSLGSLPSLRSLDISGNQILVLPDSLTTLKLTFLNIEDNPLEIPSREVREWVQSIPEYVGPHIPSDSVDLCIVM